MVRLSIVGALVLALLPPGAAQQPAQSAPGPWPPPDAYSIGNGVTAPRLIHDVKPAYTGDAMRAKLQGVIELSCVVEADGSVGPIRIVRSLDAVNGLDEEAVKALKQWRFAPGMKDNVPVRVVVTVNLTFVVRDGPSPATPVVPLAAPGPATHLTWPEGFGTATASDADNGAWVETTTEVSGLLIKMSYPQGWTMRKDVSPTQLLAIHNVMGTRSVTITPPQPSPSSIDGLTTPDSLQRLTQVNKSGPAYDPRKGEVIASGQTQTAGHFWVWLALRSDTSALPFEPVQKLFETLRIWTFATTVGGQMITANCVIAVPREADGAQRDAQLRQATAEFGGIMRHLTVGFR